MRDRATQGLAKLALEPEWEAVFEPNSYGFRPGRSAHDAIQAIFSGISQKSKMVLDADISQCFDRINHSAIMDELIAPFGLKLGIFRCLKAGVNPEFPEQGTPQGGVVTPPTILQTF
ncbi:reverse transcriptase domain-containing protein [Tolypothrix sp. PCC 7712]|nr:reverse transcriptase domain-containing protein [Tolypothrix sp. PCC 7712]